MSVVHLADPDNFGERGLGEFMGGCPADCFWYGRPLADPVVFWHAASCNSIWLHHKCARDLALALAGPYFTTHAGPRRSRAGKS